MDVITSYIIALSFEALTLVIVVTNELRGGWHREERGGTRK